MMPNTVSCEKIRIHNSHFTPEDGRKLSSLSRHPKFSSHFNSSPENGTFYGKLCCPEECLFYPYSNAPQQNETFCGELRYLKWVTALYIHICRLLLLALLNDPVDPVVWSNHTDPSDRHASNRNPIKIHTNRAQCRCLQP